MTGGSQWSIKIWSCWSREKKRKRGLDYYYYYLLKDGKLVGDWSEKNKKKKKNICIEIEVTEKRIFTVPFAILSRRESLQKASLFVCVQVIIASSCASQKTLTFHLRKRRAFFLYPKKKKKLKIIFRGNLIFSVSVHALEVVVYATRGLWWIGNLICQNSMYKLRTIIYK